MSRVSGVVFFVNDTATTEIYTLSLHDALPIFRLRQGRQRLQLRDGDRARLFSGSSPHRRRKGRHAARSEEHTSELQSRQYLVCRLLLEKKKKKDETAFFCNINTPLLIICAQFI